MRANYPQQTWQTPVNKFAIESSVGAAPCASDAHWFAKKERALEARKISKREAVMLATFPFIALSLLHHLYTGPLYARAPELFWAADAARFIAIPVLAWLLVLQPAGIRPAEIGLELSRLRQPHEFWGMAVLVPLMVVALTWPVFVVSSRYGIHVAGAFSVRQALPHGGLGKALVALYLAATAGFVEEVVWRALPWLYLSAVVPLPYRRQVYMLATSIVFAMAHVEQGPGGVFAAFWFGLVAAGLYSKLRTLWPLILGHVAVDWIAFGL